MKPFRLRQSVTVARLSDRAANRAFLGKRGRIESTPRTKKNEGLYIVRFAGGKRDGFYPEELTP